MKTLPEKRLLSQICLDERVEVFKLSNISLVPNYIPHPDAMIQAKFKDLSDKIEKELQNEIKADYPPFSCQVYDGVRRQVYSELENFIHDFSSTKKHECKHRFYKEVDIKFQPLFQDLFGVKQKYLELLVSKESELILDNAENHHEETKPNTPAEMLKLDIMNLSLDWLLLVDNIVDILIRCQLYGVRGDTIFQDFHSKVQKKFSKNQASSWPKRLFNELQFSIGYFKNLVEGRACPSLVSHIETITPTDLFTMILKVTYGDTILKYLKSVSLSNHEEFLVRLKGFMLLLVQTLTNNAQELSLQFEKCLEVTCKKEQEKEEESLYELFDQLSCFRDNLTFFDEEFTKGTFINFITL